MEHAVNFNKKTVIATILVCCIWPHHKLLISGIGAIVIFAATVLQKHLTDQYPYDITQYIYCKSERDTDGMRDVLSDFAEQCPHATPACLNSHFCPDCPYGRNP